MNHIKYVPSSAAIIQPDKHLNYVKPRVKGNMFRWKVKAGPHRKPSGIKHGIKINKLREGLDCILLLDEQAVA